MTRLALRIGGAIVGLVLIAALALCGVWVFFRADLAEILLRRGLERSGVAVERLIVDDIGLRSLSLGALSARHAETGTQIAIEDARVTFSLEAPRAAQRVDAITITRAHVVLDPDRLRGELVDAGAPKRAPIPLPFGKIAIDQVDIDLVDAARPAGEALRLSGDIDFAPQSGGTLHARTGIVDRHLTWASRDIAIDQFEGDLTARFLPGGDVRVSGILAGDLTVRQAAGEAATIDAGRLGLTARLASWREVLDGTAALSAGEFAIDIASGAIDAQMGKAQSLALDITGGISGDWSPARVIIRVRDDDALIVRHPAGQMTVSGGDDGILYKDDTTMRAGALAIRATSQDAGDPPETGLTIRFVDHYAGDRSVSVDTALSGFSASGIEIAAAEVSFRGARDVENDLKLDGDMRAKVDITRAALRAARLGEMIVSADTALTVDLRERVFELGGTTDDCLAIARMRGALIEPAADFSLRRARMCGNGKDPLFATPEPSSGLFVLAGLLRVDSARWVQGETTLEGRPPRAHLVASYWPSTGNLRVKSDLDGGAITANDTVRLSRIDAQIEAGLEAGTLSARLPALRLVMDQSGPAPAIAPLGVAGSAGLTDDQISFSIRVETEKGADLGHVNGTHDLRAGAGALNLASPSLRFDPEGLQLTDISPVFKGLIFDARGFVDSNVHVEWGPSGVASSADLSLLAFSFGGPGLAVSATRGLNGDLSFSSLSPIRSNGPQRIDIDGIDLDALQLANGSVTFELPGDDRLIVQEASFPWYGGTIGAYDAETPLSGDRAGAVLRAENIDLETLLTALDFDGLSGVGKMSGTLPLKIDDGRARIENGVLEASTDGIIRYTGPAAEAASAAGGSGADIAFDILRELRFTNLIANINGPLDGDLQFDILFEGTSQFGIDDRRLEEPVVAPVIYRMKIRAPFVALIDQARLSSDFSLQIDELLREQRKKDADRQP